MNYFCGFDYNDRSILKEVMNIHNLENITYGMFTHQARSDHPVYLDFERLESKVSQLAVCLVVIAARVSFAQGQAYYFLESL